MLPSTTIYSIISFHCIRILVNKKAKKG
uniref:Uncharacterized protein n=1 Tax=Arundo donax TaxID=35708 RepID=A0A0A9G7M8_ARUDO